MNGDEADPFCGVMGSVRCTPVVSISAFSPGPGPASTSISNGASASSSFLSVSYADVSGSSTPASVAGLARGVLETSNALISKSFSGSSVVSSASASAGGLRACESSVVSCTVSASPSVSASTSVPSGFSSYPDNETLALASKNCFQNCLVNLFSQLCTLKRETTFAPSHTSREFSAYCSTNGKILVVTIRCAWLKLWSISGLSV